MDSLARLGYQAAMTSRTLIIHHDDLGASHSANLAFVELWDRGLVSAGSVMVPCPWFPHIASIARERPDFDLGVHLTLTAEFEAFRWRPLTGVSDNGLTDANGFMPRRTPDVAGADRTAVEAEFRAQIETALKAGIDVTHLDTHMFSAALPGFLEIYIRLGRDYALPVMLPAQAGRLGADPAEAAAGLADLAARGNPDFANVVVTPFGDSVPTAQTYRDLFAELPEGLSYGAFHFTAPGDISMYAPDAAIRINEYELCRDGTFESMLGELGIATIGMRGFRDTMRRLG